MRVVLRDQQSIAYDVHSSGLRVYLGHTKKTAVHSENQYGSREYQQAR